MHKIIFKCNSYDTESNVLAVDEVNFATFLYCNLLENCKRSG